MAYLQKFIDLVRIMGKEDVQAKPAKIVAGLEPELTNAMLQSMYKLAVSGEPSDAYVAKVLGGGEIEKKEEVPQQKSQEKPSQKGKEKSEQPPPQENPRMTRPPSAPRRGPRQSGETQQPSQPVQEK